MPARFTPRRALLFGFGAGLVAPVLARFGSWLIAGRPASNLADTFLTRGLLPHLAMAVAWAFLFWCLWLIEITWPRQEDEPGSAAPIWRDKVAPLVLLPIASWMFRLVRRADYDLQRIPWLNIEVDRLLFGIVVVAALGYAFGGGFKRRKVA